MPRNAADGLFTKPSNLMASQKLILSDSESNRGREKVFVSPVQAFSEKERQRVAREKSQAV